MTCIMIVIKYFKLLIVLYDRSRRLPRVGGHYIQTPKLHIRNASTLAVS